MQAAINGFRYDTDKAECVGEYAHFQLNVYGNQCLEWRAGLYKTPRAERFFLAGEGAVSSTLGIDKDSVCKILPITRDEALEWAEKYLSPKQYGKHFPEKVKR